MRKAQLARAISLALIAGTGSSALALDVDLGNLGPGGFAIKGVEARNAGYSISGAGDVNGDGLADIILGAPGADIGGNINSGAAYVIFGKAGGADVDLENLGDGGFRLSGAYAGDHVGESVAGAGDINGDGLGDLVLGVPAAPNEVYVVFGKADGVDIDDTNFAKRGFKITGTGGYSSVGESVSGAGDVNGDGFDDLIIGVPSGSPGSVFYAGEAFVVFGKTDSATVDLDALGSGGFRIEGHDYYDYSGRSVSGAGDVDGDGLADIIIGAGFGETAVVFGKPDADPVMLSSLGLDGFLVTGATRTNVAGAGDVNGDGLADVIIGEPKTYDNIGNSYVVFGKENTTTVDVDSLGGGGFYLEGSNLFDEAGTSVAGAGDVNGDGLADVLIGAPYATVYYDKYSYTDAGESYIVFGKNNTSAVFLGSLGSGGITLQGADSFGSAGYSVSGSGDVNGDGLSDVLVGAPNVDINESFTGESYLFFSPESPGLQADYFTYAVNGDGPPLAFGVSGDGSNHSTPDGRAWIDYINGAAPASAPASLEQATLLRSAGAAPSPGTNVHWRLQSNRTSWSSAMVTFKYLESELLASEASLQLYQAPVATGPFTPLPTIVNPDTNTISAVVDSLGYFVPVASGNHVTLCSKAFSSDVPLSIPEAGGNIGPTTSALTISSGGGRLVSDVNVTALTGYYPWLSDLIFSLESPAGTSVRLIDSRCDGDTGFSFNLDDEATGGFVCPLDDGGTYRPENPLAGFRGESPTGAWILTIDDTVDIDAGQLDSWGLEVCTQVQPTASLSASATPVQPATEVTLTWDSTNADSCSGTWTGGPLATTGNTVVTPSSTTLYTLACSNDAASASDSETVTVIPLPTASLSASPTPVAPGGTSTLTWSSTDADGCDGSWSDTVGTSGTFDVNPTATTEYTLTCTNAVGSDTKMTTIDVIPLPDATLSATPSLIPLGGTSRLDWDSTNADSCGGSWAVGPVGLNGFVDVTPNATTDYTLTCSNAVGSDVEEVTVQVIDLPIANLSADPSAVAPGNPSRLSWSSSNADDCAGSWTEGAVPLSGSVDVTPGQTTEYTLTCDNPVGSDSSTTTVEVLPLPSVSLTAIPSIVAGTSQVSVRWDVEGAESCTPSEFSEVPTGWADSVGLGTSLPAGASDFTVTESTTFLLSCNNAVGSSQAQAQVTVDEVDASTYLFLLDRSSTLSKTQCAAAAATARARSYLVPADGQVALWEFGIGDPVSMRPVTDGFVSGPELRALVDGGAVTGECLSAKKNLADAVCSSLDELDQLNGLKSVWLFTSGAGDRMAFPDGSTGACAGPADLDGELPFAPGTYQKKVEDRRWLSADTAVSSVAFAGSGNPLPKGSTDNDGLPLLSQLSEDSGGAIAIVTEQATAELLDGDFESGLPNAFWSESSSVNVTPLCNAEICDSAAGSPASGAVWARFGGSPVTVDTASLVQGFSVEPGPAGRLVWSVALPQCAALDDYLELRIDDEVVWRVDGSSELCGTPSYRLQVLDVLNYADGTSHELEWSSQSAGTQILLDKITLVSGDAIFDDSFEGRSR